MSPSRAAIILAAAALACGCTSVGVKPWDRDILARQAMQLNADPTLTAFHEHNYFSKEGSASGRTFDGGGCGCN